MPLYSSRGCVNKCNYCSAIGFMTNDKYSFRLRSAKRLFDEIVYMKNRFPHIKEFRMSDNISNSKINLCCLKINKDYCLIVCNWF